MPALPPLVPTLRRAPDVVRAHRILSAVIAVVVIAALVVGVRLLTGGTPLQQALKYAPDGAQRISFTDWAGIRAELHSDVDAGSPTSKVEALMSKAYDKDLSPTSVLADSAGLLHDHYGWSPATLDWELYSQTSKGDLMVGHLPDMDADGLADKLNDMGFEKPSEDPTDGGVWDGSAVSFDQLDPDSTVTPPITYVALVPGKHLVLTSDDDVFLSKQVDRLGDQGAPDPIKKAADGLDRPLAAFMFTGDYTCSKLGMTKAEPADQEQANELIAAAGKVNPVEAFAMAAEPGGLVRAAMTFDDGDQARANADSRAKLAVGPAPGQGDNFPDRFKLGKVAANGPVVTMDMRPKADESVLSDLANGPLLFATC